MILKHCDQTISVTLTMVDGEMIADGKQYQGKVLVAVCPFCKQIIHIEAMSTAGIAASRALGLEAE